MISNQGSTDPQAIASSVELNETVECELDDGSEVFGECAAIDRDQSGLRLTLCPVDTSRYPHRICVPRVPTGWRAPYLERWAEPAGAWRRVATVTGIEL